MHRHGYKGRKFGRETGQRRALTRGLMRSLVANQSIVTTLAKAKEIRRMTEKLVTLAKRGDLTSRRLVVAKLDDVAVGNILVDVIAPQVKRDSGYLRIEKSGLRKGDNTEMAKISFVDEIKLDTKTAKKTADAPKTKKEEKK